MRLHVAQIWTVYILLHTTLLSEAAKILMLPVPMASHVSNFVAIGKELVKNGHEVYLASYDGHLEVHKDSGIQTVKLPCHDPKFCTSESMRANEAAMAEYMFQTKGDVMQSKPEFSNPMVYARKALLEEGDQFFDDVQHLNFDLMFLDGLFVVKWYYLVPHRLGLPYVALCDILDPVSVRVPWLPSFVPHLLMAASDRMTFIQRTQNLFAYVLFCFMNFLPPISHKVIQKYKGYGDFDSLEDLESRSLLFLQTTDDVLDYPKPLMPNVINIGGLTIKDAEPLSEEHLGYADASTQGLIIVSFGSGIQHLPSDIAIKMISAFSKLSENIIWRFSNQQNLTIPKNVKLSNWVPQNDYLAHKNVNLFVTHCGKNGLYESVYHAKPMLGIPLHLEQRNNAAILKNHDYGLILNMFEFSAEELYTSIREVIDNPVYKANVQKASEIFRSRRDTPAERAAYWIGHILKFGGDHLRSHAFAMPFYQYTMLDILAIVLLFVIIVVVFSLLILRMCCKYICFRKTSLSGEKKTN